VTKQNLAWDESQNVETYNVETGYIGEKYNASLVADFGRSTDPSYNWQNHFVPNDSTDNLERGLAANFAFNLYDTFKLGFSGFGGFNNDATRYVLGPNFILGFTKKLIFLSEYDYQLLYPHTPAPTQASEQRGFVSYNRLQYEFYKGVNGYIAHQLSYLDLTSGNTRIDMLGAGLDFFPRPHFEIQGEWNKKRTASVSDSYSDYAWLLLHYYL
jgi:hypothetical protein